MVLVEGDEGEEAFRDRDLGRAAVVAVLLALIYLKRSGGPVPPAMIGATIAGVGLSVLLGTGLMGLVFMSHVSGHDEEAGGEEEHDH